MLTLAFLVILFPLLGGRLGIPSLLLVGRWIRWFLFAGLFALFLEIFEISFRPDWVHFVTGFALWFVFETGYNWMGIQALSRTEKLPLFPRFYNSEDSGEWPVDKNFIQIKDWLCKAEFERIQSLKAELFEDTYLRESIYESSDRLIRIEILFLPRRDKGGRSACYTIATKTEGGGLIITDNVFLPFGGYYPENWDMCRKPLIGSLKRLLALHRERILSLKVEGIPFEDDALEEINDRQHLLERFNIENGFLVSRLQQNENGRITMDGCYRLWKEMWFLAYFGRSVC